MDERQDRLEITTGRSINTNVSAIININCLESVTHGQTIPPTHKLKNDDKELEQTDQDFDDNVSDITTISNPRRLSNSTLDDHNRGLTITLERSSSLMPPTHQASQDSKFHRYFLLVDLGQNDRAVEIILASMKRPHMRSFHFAWISFFLSFFLWFSISPLLVEVEKSLNLTKQELWISNIYSVVGCAVLRATIGPFCDRYGARLCVCVVMLFSSIASSCQSVVRTPLGLNIARTMVGFAGSSFVTCVYWTSSMFTREVAGTANAIAAGWGNLGGGAAQLVMGTILVPLFQWIYSINSLDSPEVISDKAWRTAIIIPGIVVFIVTFFIFQLSDDCPKGNYRDMQQHGYRNEVNAIKALLDGLNDRNTLVLLLQYGCCFGVETTINNLCTIYFREEFGVSLAAAAAIAAVFGLMNIFARGLGGFISDYSYALKGMRGRLVSHTILLLMEGLTLIIFASSVTLPGAVSMLIIFSIFIQMAEGSTCGIVPNVNPRITGSITGLVGSGGNIGAIFFFYLLSIYSYRFAMKIIGLIILGSSLLSPLICISGHNNMLNIKSCNEKEEAMEDDVPNVLEHVSVISNVVVMPASIPNNESRNNDPNVTPNADSSVSSENGISKSEIQISNDAEEITAIQCNPVIKNTDGNNGETLQHVNSEHNPDGSKIKAFVNDDTNLQSTTEKECNQQICEIKC